MAKHKSQSLISWQKARAEDDFSIFRDDLAKMVGLARQKADYLGYEELRYDALLDIYESGLSVSCLLYTSPSPRDVEESRMPSSA